MAAFIKSQPSASTAVSHSHIDIQANSSGPGPSFVAVTQSLSRVQLFVTSWTATRQASLSITNARSLLNSCPLSQWCHPTISSSVIPFPSCPQSFPSSGFFQMSQLFCIRWPKYWSFSIRISPSNEYSGLISFRMDWLDLLAVQGTQIHFDIWQN